MLREYSVKCGSSKLLSLINSQDEKMSGLKEFDVLGKLGEGAFSIVYRARRKEDGKQYALKKIQFNSLSARQVANCLNEVRILASISSSYIIGYKDAFYDQLTKCLCIVTEFASGGDLYHRIQSVKKKGQFLEENEIWKLVIQMVSGLKVLHSLNIFHRDLKAANVFLAKDQQSAKLGDLNVSIVSKNGMAYTQTGTPYYACPEVWNDKPYNSKSDIWSLGCVIYEMAAQRPPFQSADMQGLWKKINKGVYDRLPSRYSDDLCWLVSQCLKLNPTDRPSCDVILKSPQVRKRIHLFPEEQFNKNSTVEEMTEIQNQRLLETIKAPPRGHNFKQIKDRLPRSNYDSKDKENHRSVSLGKCDKLSTQRDETSTSRVPLSKLDSNLPELKRASSAKRPMLVKMHSADEDCKNNLSLLQEDRPPLPKKKAMIR